MELCKECKEWNMDGANKLCPKCQFCYDMVGFNISLVIKVLEEKGYRVTKVD